MEEKGHFRHINSQNKGWWKTICMFWVVRSYSPIYKKKPNQSTKQKSLTPCGSQKQTRKANKTPHILQSKLCTHHQLQLFETYLLTQHETQFTQYATGDTHQNPKTTSLISFMSVVKPGPHQSRSVGSCICCVTLIVCLQVTKMTVIKKKL